MTGPMMDPEFVKHVKTHTPRINKDLVKGLARIHMKEADKFVDRIFKSAATGFPPQVTYHGCRICTPQDMYRHSLRSGSSKRRRRQGVAGKGSSEKQYEVARTDFYYIEPILHFEGKPLNTVTALAMPVVGQGGSVVISDTTWFISPVLADRVISIGSEHIFVRLLRDRLTFSRLPAGYGVMINGIKESVGIVVSQIYHQKKGAGEPKPHTNAKTSMAHYLFCKYGFQETLKKYAKCDVVVGDNLSPTDYPPDKWFLYSTTGIAPRMYGSRKRSFSYVAPSICVAVPAEQHCERAKVLIAALFYVADYFPTFIRSDYVHDPKTWISPIGYILLSEDMNRGKLQEQMMNHIESLDDYADPFVIENMRRIGIEINDIYDFFAMITENFGYWITNGQDKINSMYDKELSVLYFVFFDVIKAIFGLNFKLKAASKKGLTQNDVENIVKDCLKSGLMYWLIKSHGEVASKSSPTDNMAFKATADLVPQTATGRRTKGRGSDRGTIGDPSKKRHVSIGEVASMACPTKPDPTGRSGINHWMTLDETRSLIVPNPEFKEMLDRVSIMLSIRSTPDANDTVEHIPDEPEIDDAED